MQDKTFTDLPAETLNEISSYLNLEDMIKFKSVNRFNRGWVKKFNGKLRIKSSNDLKNITIFLSQLQLLKYVSKITIDFSYKNGTREYERFNKNCLEKFPNVREICVSSSDQNDLRYSNLHEIIIPNSVKKIFIPFIT
ncbi:MAG: hypothetical protein BGO27_07080 [Alphaproteobacteria bacterium 33-17]|nr:MAG: hypothetical protein BGO27_07080 [Alphaproteobacteria bacterium 33-17]